jgi:transposase-like protein
METCDMNEPSIPKRQRMNWSPEERVDWVRMLERSGQSVAEFCRANDLPEATLSLWRSKLRGPETPVDESPLVEVPLPPVSVPKKGMALRARLPGGIELEVASGTDVQWLVGVLRALV